MRFEREPYQGGETDSVELNIVRMGHAAAEGKSFLGIGLQDGEGTEYVVVIDNRDSADELIRTIQRSANMVWPLN